MGKRAFLSEFDTAQILRRYNAATVVGLLREVAKCEHSKLDWNAVAKKLSTSIGSARECQALWRHIAYRTDLAEFYDDDEQPSDDDSDVDFELLPSPAVSSEANAEVVRWVKTDMQRFDIGSGKKKGESKSKSRSHQQPQPDAGLQTNSNQGGKDGSQKGTSNGAGDGNTASPPGGRAGGSATPECTLAKAALGQSERKKRKLWTPDEDEELIAAVDKFGEGNWTNILKGSFTHERTAAQLSQRWALIRKRREAVQAAANRLSFHSAAAEQGNGSRTPPADQSLLQLHSTQNGTNPAPQNRNPTENGTIPAPQNGNPTQNGTHPTQNGTHPTQNGTHSTQNGTHATQNGTHAAQNGTHAAQNGTNAAQNGSSPQNGTSSEEDGSPAQNGATPAQNGTSFTQNGTSPAQNGNSSANTSPVVPPGTPLENGSAIDVLPSNTAAMASIPPSSASQSQNPVPSPPTACPSQGTNGASNGSVATISSVGVGTSIRAAPNGQALAPAGGGGGGDAARSTAGSSTPMAVGQIQNPSAKSVSVGVGTGRMIAPGAVVMSAAAAQAASSGTLNSGQPKYAGRSNGRGAASKAVTGPDPGVQAAAMAAGARIAPASTLLQAGHSGNVVHIRPGGGAVSKAGQGLGHNASGGSRGTSGAIVHYITTQKPAQQSKSQAGKANGNINTNSSINNNNNIINSSSQASSSAAANGSLSPAKSSSISPTAPK